jgi:hypothetical protein
VEALEDRSVPSTFTVTSTLDDGSAGSLRWAVGQASSSAGADTIVFDKGVLSTPQTITLTGGQLELTDAATTTIRGPAAGVTISGNHASRVFAIDSGASAALSGLTITEGKVSGGFGPPGPGDSGGGLSNSGTLKLSGCTISNNSASVGGGSTTAQARSSSPTAP